MSWDVFWEVSWAMRPSYRHLRRLSRHGVWAAELAVPRRREAHPAERFGFHRLRDRIGAVFRRPRSAHDLRGARKARDVSLGDGLNVAAVRLDAEAQTLRRLGGDVKRAEHPVPHRKAAA